jgi:1-acyl-sn-glycerol-3-phosphate acyltransferase
MIFARSLLFVALFYLWCVFVGLVMIPMMLGPQRWTLWAMRTWALGVTELLELTCDIKVEVRGLQHLPGRPALIAAKHQCMLDTMAPIAALPYASYAMKRELLRIPFYGWYCVKAGMIVLDREGHSKALKKLVADAKDRVAQGRQIVIFPEGHRMDPGAAPDYKPGVAALYRDLGMPCVPMATNSGVHWPAHGFLRRPGKIVFEFLEPIPPGLHRGEFMRTLIERTETASAALLSE